MPLALDRFPLSFDAHTALQDVAHRSDAIVTMPASKAVQLAASGMIDARHGVDAMTLASSPVHVIRDSRFGQFPAQRDHHRAMKMRTWNRLGH
ncbi:hypothetical protein BLA18112_04676 [Burkholderia lata]|uniref:Uncharacterized protein n=1 Tax=Burkholderia lata (strain ATCC 17760 / DSM 23089 / LMG 22485 / NCIMB 9086 / R18194 / 383) TaxID=482957 RepID=A0A6P2XNB5_BURL3|nr:hypothetical protein [Burkholderia lata]VWD11242.1 hypothetical protein BLA18112_04676 [Burkholderia lata]